MKRRKIVLLTAVVLLLALLVLVFIAANRDDRDAKADDPAGQITKETLQDDNDIKHEASETENGDAVDFISRETAKKLIKAENEAYEEGDIICRDFSSFSGQYPEDGKDELVENVAAMLVTNQAEQYLDFAALEYDIDGQEALFIVTGLPPGKSAWVMEQSRLRIDADAQFTYKGCADAYRENVITSTDKLKITSSGNMLSVKNQTEKAMKDVCVYYKRYHTDNHYFGGITYVANFGEIKAGESLEKLAGHFDEENTEIVRISWHDNEKNK